MRKLSKSAWRGKCRQIFGQIAAIAGKPLCRRVISIAFTVCLVGGLAAVYLGEFDAEESARAANAGTGEYTVYKDAATDTDAQPEINAATESDADMEATATDAGPEEDETEAELEATATDALAADGTDMYEPDGRNTMMESLWDPNFMELMTIPGSDILRCYVSEITVLDSLSEAPADAWDVSIGQDGSVMAWVTGNEEEMYHLYFAADGPVRAPEKSYYLFAYYSGIKELSFNGNFDTSSAVSLLGLFEGCSSLETLDVSDLDTSNAVELSYMFYGCRNLTGLDLGNFDTAKVIATDFMFYNCRNLTSLDLGNFDTSKVETMTAMFGECSSLTQLIENFDMTNVTDTSYMYAGTIWEGQ